MRKKRNVIAIALLSLSSLILVPQPVYTITTPPFDAGRVSFVVEVGSLRIPYQVMGVFVMPGTELPVRVVDAGARASFQVTATGGDLKPISKRKWIWQAPMEPGLYPIRIVNRLNHETMQLNVFVMVPASRMKGEYLNGYRIGKYPKPKNGLAAYLPPAGFIEVTKENEHVRVAPHFRLGQFLCKQKGGYPKYLVLKERLLLKLELLLEDVNRHYIRAQTFTVMSGYRTPYYNHTLGNVKYSAHQYGMAADIFLDSVRVDGKMDDVNHDGRVDYNDAAELFAFIDKLSLTRRYRPFIGGLGKYRGTRAHGPFIHVDVRGYKARWG